MINYKKYLPYLIAVLSFAAAAYLFTPQVLQKKVVKPERHCFMERYGKRDNYI